mmetsp:Transcript_33547/g.105647  ORF Transcript_33547/g.105647 Transcript_33547/m.105647 type:complete len:205 (+) Transcript_33547:587-1201(+)
MPSPTSSRSRASRRSGPRAPAEATTPSSTTPARPGRGSTASSTATRRALAPPSAKSWSRSTRRVSRPSPSSSAASSRPSRSPSSPPASPPIRSRPPPAAARASRVTGGCACAPARSPPPVRSAQRRGRAGLESVSCVGSWTARARSPTGWRGVERLTLSAGRRGSRDRSEPSPREPNPRLDLESPLSLCTVRGAPLSLLHVPLT